MSAIDHRTFRNALGAFATGVTVVTARAEGGDVGVTANSFNSVSLDPPMVLWSLHKQSKSMEAFAPGACFAVHVLAASQQDISDRFAKAGVDKFAGLDAGRGIGEVALLEGCVARFQCRLAFRYDGGDHDILVGEVVDFDHAAGAPLLYHGGRYAGIRSANAASGSESAAAGELLQLISRAYHLLYADARKAFAARGLSEEGYYVLRLLAQRESASFEALAQMVSRSGRSLGQADISALVDRGEITPLGDGAFELAPAGSRTMLELAAIRLAAEEHALSGMDRSEVDALKDLLRGLFRGGEVDCSASRSSGENS